MQKFLHWLDRLQQRHRLLAFCVAVVKKYDEDETGHQAALLTYYGFLSLFPLLLVLATLVQSITDSHSELQASIVQGTTNYFPVLGSQLSSHIQTLHTNGLALAIGILFTLYGARGVADAFRNGVQHIWKVPLNKRDVFPKSTLKSLAIIIVAGIGFVIASVSIALASATGQGWVFKALTIAINLGIWCALFILLLNISLPRHVSFKETRAGALTAAVGLVILQTLGGFILKRELQHLDALYTYFALSLGLIFWIYLQVQVVFYSLQIAAVRSQKLWPRGLSGDHQTAADKIAQKNRGY